MAPLEPWFNKTWRPREIELQQWIVFTPIKYKAPASCQWIGLAAPAPPADHAKLVRHCQEITETDIVCVSRAHSNMTPLCVMLLCRTGTLQKAVSVTVPVLRRTMSGREDAPKALMLRRDTKLTHLFIDRA